MLRKMAFPLHMISLQLDVSAFIPFTPVFSFLSPSPNPSFPSILSPHPPPPSSTFSLTILLALPANPKQTQFASHSQTPLLNPR